jgi:hypothetical protein
LIFLPYPRSFLFQQEARMQKPIRRIAICTGGGDAPGLNAVIRATVTAAANRGWECMGIRDGFSGILQPERYPQGGVHLLTRDRVRGISHLGGTIIGTTNKGNPFHYPVPQSDGSVLDTDRSGEILAYFEREGIDALVSVGGDGSLTMPTSCTAKVCAWWVCPRPSTTIWTKPTPPSVLTLPCRLRPNAWIACTARLRAISASWWSK